MRTSAACVGVFAAWLCGGCADPHAEDKAAIRGALEQLDRANEACNGEMAVEVMCRRSLDEYTRLVRIALDGKEPDVRSLPPNELEQVIQMRNRLTRAELAPMDGRAYQTYFTGQCWYSSDFMGSESSWRDSIGTIKVFGESASADLLDERGRPSGYTMEFFFEDGRWKVNEFSSHQLHTVQSHEYADEIGASIEEILIAEEEALMGREIKRGIWEPMR